MQASENLFGFESSQPTVGIGIAPIQHTLADFYRRSGIAPCPEDLYKVVVSIAYSWLVVKVAPMCYNKDYSTAGAVVSGVVAGGSSALVRACMVPFAAVLVMSPPMT